MDEILKCENCGVVLIRADDQRTCRFHNRNVCSTCCRRCRYHRNYSGLWQCIAPRTADPEEERMRAAEVALTSARIDFNEEKRALNRMIIKGKSHMAIDNQIQKLDIARRRYNRALTEYRGLASEAES